MLADFGDFGAAAGAKIPRGSTAPPDFTVAKQAGKAVK
jgi:hypothetical protein